MMKKILYFLLPAMLLASCNDLEDKVYSELLAGDYPENQIQAQLITNAAYSTLRSHADGGWWFAQEISADLIVAPTRSADWDDGGKWRALHTHTWDPNTEAIGGMWSNCFNGVTECNKAIEYLGNTEASRNAVSQMKVLRSYFYFLLIDNYGAVPYITSFANAPKVPVKTSRAAIYDSIVNEVKNAIPFLSGTSKSSVNKFSAYALLAKLYLNAQIFKGEGKWQECENACDSVIAGPYSLEANRLAPFITENENSTENIFTIPYDEDNYQGFLLHRRTLHYNSTASYNANTTFWNGFCASEYLVDLFEDADQRRNGFLLGVQRATDGTEITDPGAGNTVLQFVKEIPALRMDNSFTSVQIRMSGARLVKFEVKKGVKDNLSNDFPIFRLADFILMKAECELRKEGGSVSVAKDLINSVRTKAGATVWNDSEITLDNLLEERAREVWFEGHRRQDLIRFDKFKDAWWEKAADNEQNYVYPIPQWAVDSNPNLKN